jgi:hypothetical protein
MEPFMLTIPGDVNGDCKVDFIDFNIFAGAYGSQIGDSNYLRAADLDSDGLINFTDFLLFRNYYGTSCE